MREIKDFKPFIPSNDYEVSKAFYECMGFEINWDSDEACEIDTKFGYRFLLLPKNHNNYSESLMLPLVAKPELIHGINNNARLGPSWNTIAFCGGS